MPVLDEVISPARLQQRNSILEQLREIRDLPTLPTVFVHILTAMRKPHTSVKELARIVEADQAITMKLLRLVNSSFYGLSRTVASVHQAIVLLGANALKNVIISASVFRALGGVGGDKHFNREAFWQHAVGCGMIGRFLGNRIGFGRDEEGFIAGLIHDIGKVVLDQYFHENLIAVVRRVIQDRLSFYEAERRAFAVTHAEIGAFLAETWRLPERLVDTIAQHHEFVPVSPHADLVALVQVSDMLARKYKVGSGGDELIPKIAPPVWDQLKLNPVQVELWDAEIQAEIARGKELLDMMMS